MILRVQRPSQSTRVNITNEKSSIPPNPTNKVKWRDDFEHYDNDSNYPFFSSSLIVTEQTPLWSSFQKIELCVFSFEQSLAESTEFIDDAFHGYETHPGVEPTSISFVEKGAPTTTIAERPITTRGKDKQVQRHI